MLYSPHALTAFTTQTLSPKPTNNFTNFNHRIPKTHPSHHVVSKQRRRNSDRSAVHPIHHHRHHQHRGTARKRPERHPPRCRPPLRALLRLQIQIRRQIRLRRHPRPHPTNANSLRLQRLHPALKNWHPRPPRSNLRPARKKSLALPRGPPRWPPVHRYPRLDPRGVGFAFAHPQGGSSARC